MSEAKGPFETFEAPEWTCQWTEMPQPAQVGSLMILDCKGAPVTDRPGALTSKIFVETPNPYSLKVLSSNFLDFDHAQMVMTGYVPGSYSGVPMGFVNEKGQPIFKVRDLSWQVESVISNGEKFEKPFGPFGPFGVKVPVWYWGAWALVVVLVGLALYRMLRKVWARKRTRDGLLVHATALSPFNQFSKDLRLLLRQQGPGGGPRRAEELDSHFRMFLVRELLIPANEWSVGDIIAEIKTRHKKLFHEQWTSLRRTLHELDRAKKIASLKVEDWEQLLGMTRKAAQEIQRSRQGGGI